MKFRHVGKEFWQRNQSAWKNNGEIHLSHKNGGSIACNQAGQYGELPAVPFGFNVPDQADQKGNGTQQKVFSRAEIFRIAAAKGSGAYGEERIPDGRHHRGRYNGSDYFFPVFGQKSQSPLQNTAHQDGSDDGRIAVIGRHSAEHRYKGKADSHYNRKAGADFPDGIELN